MESSHIFYSPTLIFCLIRDIVFTLIIIHSFVSQCLGIRRCTFLVSGKITSSSKYSLQKHKFPFNIAVGDEKRLWHLRCWRPWKRQAAIRVTGLKGRQRAGRRARWLSKDMSLFSCISHMDGTVRAKAIYTPMLLKCPIRWRVRGQRGEKERHRIFCLSWNHE